MARHWLIWEIVSNRIFCIGLNKTGTTSLHAAFGILGIPSAHWVCEEGNIKQIIARNFEQRRPLLSGLERYVAISDWNMQHTARLYQLFDEQYPGSKFILNTRDIDDWLESRARHVARKPDLKELRREHPDSSWLNVDRDAWRREFEEHHADVQRYFADRPNDLLVMDVTGGDGWEKLCPFLNLPLPAEPFPHRNAAAFARTKDVFSRAVAVLRRMNGK